MEMEDPGTEWLQTAMDLPVSASLGPMGSVFRKLYSLKATKEILSAGVNEGEIQSLKKDLEGLCITLKDLSDANDTSFTAKYWMNEVRQVCYDAENYLDKVMSPSKMCWLHKLLKRRAQIATDFSSLVARVAGARGRHGRFLSMTPELSLQQPVAGVRTPELSLKLSVPVAHMEDLMKLLAFDDKKQRRRKVVSIFGFAGVGKTTIARTLYRRFGGKFQCRAFLRVTRQPDIKRLLTSLLSQIKAPLADSFADVDVLAANIRKHLEHKRHFIIFDDVWTPSVWDTIRHALPDCNSCSRVLTITQIEDVALASCNYQSKYIFEMRPLYDYQSRELLSSGVSDSEGGSLDFKEVSYGVITTSGGLPLAAVNTSNISEPNLVWKQWEQIRESLSSILSSNPACESMEEVINLVYDSLPRHLKTCLLYLNMYPEGYTISKNVLVNQWIVEGFIQIPRKKEGCIGAVKQQDTGDDDEKEHVRVARGYFAELAGTGMIQPVDINDIGEVLSCTIHHMVLDLIKRKSMEDNFIITVDKFPSTLVLPDMVRRLSVQFAGAKGSKIPESVVLSQVRSLMFFGFSGCAPSTRDCRFLQVLNLHIWADQDKMLDLSTISELLRLRYFKIECNITVKFPAKIRMLQYLRTLEVDAELSVVPSDIFSLKSLCHLCIPRQFNLPDGIVNMVSLRSLGYFNLSTSSRDNVLGLGKLTKLWDLRLTCSTVTSGHLFDNMKHLASVLGELCELKSLILDSGVSTVIISCDSLNSVSCSPALLERLEFPLIFIFPSLPKWFGDLNKLCILKIAVRQTSVEDINILKGLHALTRLSMSVWMSPETRIVFGKEGFTVLRYLKFACSALCLTFAEGAMRKVERLKLRFNANRCEQLDLGHAGFKHLLGLKEISVKLGIIGADELENKTALLMDIFRKLPSSPNFNVQLVDRIFFERSTGINEEAHQTTSTQDALLDTRSFDSGTFGAPQTSLQMQIGEDEYNIRSALEATPSNYPKEDLITSEISEEGLDEKRGVEETVLAKDKKQAVSRISMPLGSISHLQDPGEGEDKINKREKHHTLIKQEGIEDKIIEHGASEQDATGTFVASESSLCLNNPGSDCSQIAGKASKDYFLEDLYCSKTNDKSMELSALRDITNEFSTESEIGRGTYGVVYKGVLRDGRFIAVKKFESTINNSSFLGEVDCLTRIHHPNIVRYLGFCAGAYSHLAKLGELNVLAQSSHQLICFEYLHNGSLQRHLDTRPCRLAWHMCYKIIQGICLGLHYLHENHIIHRDMKPDNILLDDDMTPKIKDFGFSRLLGDGRSRIITEEICGTLRYMAPECLFDGVFTAKSDIYSLGIIIGQIVMGHGKTSTNEIVLAWSRRMNLDGPERHTALEQVTKCIEISVSCRQHEARNRPVMRDVLRRLGITKTSDSLGGMNASSLPPSAIGKGPEVQSETSGKEPGDTNPEKSTRLLETTTASAKCKMLASRSLQIANNKRWHWRWNSIQGSRFPECAELMGLHDFALAGEIPPRELCAGKSYEVYLVYKLARRTSGLKGIVQTSSLRLYGEVILDTNKVSLDPEARGSASDVTYPVARGDGWLELKLAEFTNDDEMITEKGVIVDLRDENVSMEKRGLIVEGMEFRSI